MNNTLQLYVDDEKTIKGYPVTSPDRVIDENGKSVKDKLKNNVKYDVVGKATAPSLNLGYDVSEIKKQINVIEEQMYKKASKLIISPMDFGAYGDGISDDTEAIKKCFSYANKNKLKVQIENRTFLISETIDIPSISIEGSGKDTIFKAKKEFKNGSNNSIFNINQDNVIIKNLTIDHNGSSRDNLEQNVSYSLTISNSNNCLFDNVTFLDVGLNKKIVALSGGHFVNIIAKDNDNDISGGLVGNCSNHKFINCSFINNKTAISAFAVRVRTNWTDKRQQSEFIHHAENITFENCYFSGHFAWNVLEFAGGGTRYNMVNNCFFEGMSKTSIDFDKGCYGNIASANIIRNGGNPIDIPDEAGELACINVHGAGVGTNIENTYKTHDCKVINNTIININNDNDNSTMSSLINIGYANNTLISGNKLYGLNNKRLGRAISIDHQTTNLIIRENEIQHCRMGIATNSNARNSIDNVIIENNNIETATSPIILTQGNEKGTARCVIKNNKIKCEDTDSNKGITVTIGFLEAKVENNYVDGGVDNFHLFVYNLYCTGNTGVNSKTYGMRLNTDSASKSCLLCNNMSKNINKGNGTVTGLGNSFSI